MKTISTTGTCNAPINGNTYTFGSQQYAISYFGNYSGNALTDSFIGGNDVVLMAVPEPGAALLGGVGLLCLHLSHGASSMFQSLGWKNEAYRPLLDKLARVVAVLIFLGYSSIPVAILLGYGKEALK